MRVKVLFFGVLGDKAGSREKIYEGVTDTDSLERQVAETIPGLEGYSYRIALNQALVTGNAPLSDGDEVAFLPPFAGG
jgi:sulfur-carrier protein